MNELLDRLRALGSFGRFSGAVLVRLVVPTWPGGEGARHLLQLVLRCALPVVADDGLEEHAVPRRAPIGLRAER